MPRPSPTPPGCRRRTTRPGRPPRTARPRGPARDRGTTGAGRRRAISVTIVMPRAAMKNRSEKLSPPRPAQDDEAQQHEAHVVEPAGDLEAVTLVGARLGLRPAAPAARRRPGGSGAGARPRPPGRTGSRRPRAARSPGPPGSATTASASSASTSGINGRERSRPSDGTQLGAEAGAAVARRPARRPERASPITHHREAHGAGDHERRGHALHAPHGHEHRERRDQCDQRHQLRHGPEPGPAEPARAVGEDPPGRDQQRAHQHDPHESAPRSRTRCRRRTAPATRRRPPAPPRPPAHAATVSRKKRQSLRRASTGSLCAATCG